MREVPHLRILIIIISILAFRVGSGQDLSHFKDTKVSFHGNISTIGIFYHSSGIQPRKLPFSYIVSGNFNLNLKGLVLPFSFSFSDKNFSYRQPFNQFGISPKYKWITLYLGYRNISFSRYVLGGHTILGAGIELTPGLFRFGIVYGRLRRKTNQASNIFNPISDTLTAYTRKMLSFKIGVGNRKNFADLVILRAYDDSTSITNDSILNEENRFPASNFVTGLNTRFSFGKNVHFEGEAAYSVFTNNQKSSPIENVPGIVSKIIPINISSQGYLAIRASLIYQNNKGLKFGLKYRRIDPGYKSMGTYFINNDLENMTFNTGFAAFKRKLHFNGSIGLERNNLNNARNATTKKVIGSAMFSYNPIRQFGITANYSNYTIDQQPGRIQIADSVKLYQTNGTLIIMPHMQLMDKNNKVSQYISLIYTQMNLNDKNSYTGNTNSFTNINNILSYNITFLNHGLTVLTSFNYNMVKIFFGNSTNLGGSIGVNKSFLKNKIMLGINGNITQSKNKQRTYITYNTAINAQARLGKHHHLRLKIVYINRKDNSNIHQTSVEQIGDLSYVFSF